MLEKIYGEVRMGYDLEMPTALENYKYSVVYKDLKNIFYGLQNYRGHKNFVKAKKLSKCDFFVPSPGFIVEFDESQHFTLPRKIALQNYPENLKVGFSKDKWIVLCDKINGVDNEPIYRDEQRAWYDTLKDFAPRVKELKPTRRIFAKDCKWCSLDPKNPADVNKFRRIIEQKRGIEVFKDPNPSIARIILAREWHGSTREAKSVLKTVCGAWPESVKVGFLITCGGFIEFDWPLEMPLIDDSKYPNQKAVNVLIECAQKKIEEVLDETIKGKLRKCTRYITLGIDSHKEKISLVQNYIKEQHIELVFIVDLEEQKSWWTGKFYPTPGQQNKLVRIEDLNTHFLNLDVGKIMLLGCHDLNVFNPRSKNAKGWRAKLNTEFKKLAVKEDPEIVLHHPHTTDCVRTWSAAWSQLRKSHPNAGLYASAGRYYRESGARSGLQQVLRKTKLGNTLDFVIWQN